MANDKPEISAIVCFFCKYFGLAVHTRTSRMFLKRNLNASRLSEHLIRYRGGKVPDGSDLESTV